MHLSATPTRFQSLTILPMVALFLAVRLPGLLSLPPFLDERIMLSYARDIPPGTMGISGPLVDGGKPLMVLAVRGVAAIVSFTSTVTGGTTEIDWLSIGRFTSVLAGLVAMLGCYRLGLELWSRRVAVLSALVYISVPYFHFHDRMVLAEPFLTASGLWVAVLSIRLTHGPRGNPLTLSVLVLLTLASKLLPALFFVAFPLWTWLWFRQTEEGSSVARIIASYMALVVPALIAVLVVGPQRLAGSVGSNLTKVLQDQFGGRVPSLADVSGHAVAHFQNIFEWMSLYATLPGSLVLLTVVIVVAVRRERKSLFLVASSLLFVLLFLLVPGWLVPRYLTPAAALMVPTVAWILDLALRRLEVNRSNSACIRRHIFGSIGSAALVVCSLTSLLASMQFMYLAGRSPAALDLPKQDREQYIEGWPSGYGYRQALDWIGSDSSSSERPLLVGRYLNSNFELEARKAGMDTLIVPELRYLGYPKELTEEVRADFSDKLRSPTRVVYFLEERSTAGELASEQTVEKLRVVPMASFSKPGGVSYVQVYRVFPTEDWIESRITRDLLQAAAEGAMRVSPPPGTRPEDYVHLRDFQIGNDIRRVLFMHPASSASIGLKIPTKARFEASIAMEQTTWDKGGDGVDFAVEVRDGDASEIVFDTHLDPQMNPDHRRWTDISIPLERYGNREVILILSTRPHGSADFDWAGWGRPRISLP